jgi:hypothetical protein
MLLAVCAGLLCTARTAGIQAGFAALLTLALAWQPLKEVVYLRGTRCVRRIEWTAEGIWRISNGAEPFAPLRLHPASAVVGPLMFLIWSQDGRKRWCVLDCARLDRRLWRTLLGRLRLEAGRSPRRVIPASC